MADGTAGRGSSSQPQGRFRRLVRSLGWLAGGYLGVIVVLMLLENTLLYHPYDASPGNWVPPPAAQTVEDVWVETANGTRIHGWWFPCPGASGALLYAHGNAGNLSWRGQAAVALKEALGESVLLFDYPGYGKSGGSVSEAGCYAAADAMYDWLTATRKIPAKHVILFGKSLGGGIATDLAVRRPHRALVLVKSFTSIPDMAQRQFPFLPARWLVRNKFDNLEKIGRCRAPVMIANSDRDELIPLWMGERLLAAAPEPKQFFLLANAAHNDPLPPAFLAGLAEFLRETAPLTNGPGK